MTKQLTPETDYGIFKCGKNNINAKLSIPKVRLIRNLLKYGNTQKAIGNVFGVSQDTISKINAGRTWRWI